MEFYEHRKIWNKGKLFGQKTPLKPRDICMTVSDGII